MSGSRITIVIAVSVITAGTEAQTTVAVGTGQTLTESDLAAGLFDGQPFALAPDTTFEINDGGVIGPIGTRFPDPSMPFAFGDAVVNINSGGLFDSAAQESLVAAVTINVAPGGVIAPAFHVDPGCSITIDGGSVGDGFDAEFSEITINGGAIGNDFVATECDVVVTGSSISEGFIVAGGTTEVSGGVIENFWRAVSGVVSITDGVITHFEADVESTATVSGGVLQLLTSGAGSSVTVSGGIIERTVTVLEDGGIEITGGQMGLVNVFDRGAFTMSGGSVERITAVDGSRVRLSGGALGATFLAFDGSEVTLRVRSLSIDGSPVTLMEGTPLIISERAGALLEATLLDGSIIDLTLNDAFVVNEDLVAPMATLAVEFEACPCERAGDPMVIDILDLLDYIAVWLVSDPAADLNGGGVSITDLLEFLACWLPSNGGGVCV